MAPNAIDSLTRKLVWESRDRMEFRILIESIRTHLEYIVSPNRHIEYISVCLEGNSCDDRGILRFVMLRLCQP